jgi:hypothetical protein
MSDPLSLGKITYAVIRDGVDPVYCVMRRYEPTFEFTGDVRPTYWETLAKDLTLEEANNLRRVLEAANT